MKKLILGLCFVGASSLMGGCTSTEVGTVGGAAAGAGIGYAVSGNGLGTLIGAGAGALIGNQIGQSQDRYYYNRGYYHRGYHHGGYYHRY